MSYITGGGIFYGGGFITIGVGTTQTPVYSSFVISSILVGTTLTLSVASTSPAPITFSLTTTPSTGVATITNGNTLNILGLGTVTVTASQPAYNNLYFSGSTSTTFSVTSVPSTLTANLSLVFTPTTSDATSYSIAGNATIATVNGNQVFSISGNGTITVYLGTVTRDFSTGIQPLIMGSRGSSNPITGSYSLSFLLFYTTINTTQTIVFNDNNNPYFLFGFDGTNRNFAMYINHTTKTTASLSSDLSMNTWNSFVITYDSLTAGGTVQLYVNTVPLTMANNTGITSAVDVNPLVLGSTGSIPSFTGYVNDVLIYNNVITTSVIQQIYSFEQTTQTLANVITTTTPGGTIAPTSTIVTTYPSTVQLYNLYQLFGYTLVICSQTLVNNANQRIFEFNNASSAPTEYIYASPYTSGSSQSGLYAYSTLSSATYATDLSNSTIYTLYFSYSTNRIIMNGYQADASGNLTSKTSQSLSYDTSGTVYNPSFMTDCSNLWFGKSGTTTNYYYNGSYSQICLYNGNLNTDASYSYLKELITTPSINTYTSTTYTFGATSHFIPVTVSVSGSVTSTATNIKVNGTSTTSGGYLTLSSFSTTATTNSYGIGQPIIWGSGTSSFGTPTNITIATPYTPALLSKYTSYFNGKTIKYVSPSYNGYFYIDSLNRVHSGGTPNANGQLGNGQVQFSTNYALSDITNNGSFRGATIVQIISTGNYVMALDSSGNIHGFGDDVNTGCLAQGVARTTAYVPFNITTSSSLNSIYNRKIVSTAGSGSTMVVADSSGYVHTCGVGSGGTNGNNPTTNTSTSNRTQNISVVGASTGTNITGSSLIGRFITSVYAAAQQSTLFALDSSGYLHIWGGFGTFGTIVNTFANGTTSNNIYLPINISTLKTLPNNVFYGKTIIGMTNNVAYGGAGILFWDSNGYMYSWQTSIYDNTYPLIVNNIIGSSLFGKKVIGGATSGYISYALDSNGQLHSWANNQNSNPGITTGLGDGTYGSYNYPVNLSSNINSILYGKNIVNININGGGGGSVWSILALYSSGATYISPTAPVNNTVSNKVYAFGTTNNGLFGNGTTANPSTANTMYQGVTGFGDLSLNHSSIVGIYTTPNSQVVYFLDTSGLAYMCNTTANNNQSFYQAYSNITPLCISNFGSLENVTIQSISVGYGSIFALDTSGKVHGWGSTDMGYGTLLTSSSTPVRISDLSSSALYGKTIIQVLGSTFNANNYAIDTSQNIYYWSTSITTPILYTGWNSYLQNPMKTVFTYYSTSYPILLDVTGIVADYNISTIMPSLIGTTIFSLATTQNGTYGSSHTGAIDSSGNVWMWGINANGQLGNGTTTTSTVAINISALSTGSLYRKKAISLYCGYNASVAVDTSGNIHYWGTTSTLTTSNNLWPVLISSTYASQLNQPDLTVALGSGNGYIALNYTGTIPTKLIWNGVYLAVGTTTTLPAPLSNSPGAFVYYSSNPLVASISGNQITVYSKGTVTISVYQLASGTYSAASKSITNTMQNGVYTQIFGTNFYITLTGNNLFGSTTSTLPILWQGWNGYGDISSNGNNMVKVVAVANEGSIGLDNTGKLYVCSINSNASSFNCGVNNAYVPTSIMNSGSLVGRTIIDFVATGYGHNGSCYAIDSSGNLHGWGSSIYTMGVGDGTTTAYTTPQNLSNVSSTVLYQKKMVQISTSYNSGQIALDSSNQVYIWGIYNYTFYNGVTGYTATTTPLNVTTFGSLNGVTVVQVASGYGLYALDSSGQVHMLGSNGPYTINTFNNISNIAGSSLNNVIVAKFIISNSLPLNLTGFLDSAGNVHTWGSTVGDGTTTAYVNTVNISQITTSPIYGKQIMFGHVNNVATHLIDTSGVVYYWGSTGYSSPNNLLPYSIDLSYSQFQNNKIIYASMMYGGAGSNFAHYVAQYSTTTNQHRSIVHLSPLFLSQ
jgi:alpha-tubulin suppressor-like RCC1 family protein